MNHVILSTSPSPSNKPTRRLGRPSQELRGLLGIDLPMLVTDGERARSWVGSGVVPPILRIEAGHETETLIPAPLQPSYSAAYRSSFSSMGDGARSPASLGIAWRCGTVPCAPMNYADPNALGRDKPGNVAGMLGTQLLTAAADYFWHGWRRLPIEPVAQQWPCLFLSATNQRRVRPREAGRARVPSRLTACRLSRFNA